MALKVMAWNVLDAFSDPVRAQGVIEAVNQYGPDAVVFPEAYQEGQEEHLAEVLAQFEANGYKTVHGLYDDDDGRLDRHGIVGIVRHEASDGDPSLVSLGTRNAVHIPLFDQVVQMRADFFGGHLDDRGEQRRLAQAEVLLALAETAVGPVILGGDFNAMHRDDPWARRLRPLRWLAQRLPSVDPRPGYKPPIHRRIGSLASRLTQMAQGTTMARLMRAGFKESALVGHPGTKGPFNLDHILTRGFAFASQRTFEETPYSDHRRIAAYCLMPKVVARP